MAGASPLTEPEYQPEEYDIRKAMEEDAERRLRYQMRVENAMRAQVSGYKDIVVPERPSIPSAPEESIRPPKDLNEADDALRAAKERLAQARIELESFTKDTDSIMPASDEAAAQILERGGVIARARKDFEEQERQLASAEQDLARAREAAMSNPTQVEELFAEVGRKMPLVAGLGNALLQTLMLPGDVLKGLAMTGISGVGEVTGSPFTQTDVEMGVGDWLKEATLLPALLTPSESKLRARGRELTDKTFRGMEVAGELLATTPVMQELARTTGYRVEELSGKMLGTASSIFVDLALDPLNVIGGMGPVTKGSKLRGLAQVNVGALTTASAVKALEDVPDIAKALGGFESAFKIATEGTLTADLVKAGKTADEAAELSKAFDAAVTLRLTSYRGMASSMPEEWARQVAHELKKLPQTEATKKQLDAVGRVSEFGKDVDPINGRTIREQISLGQRGKVLAALQNRYGDRAWYKKLGNPWSLLAGTSLAHDVADVPEVFAVYAAQRMMRGNAAREFMRLEQDSVQAVANILNKFDEDEVAQLMERLPGVVERVKAPARAALREGIDGPMKEALLDLADLYDESAATYRAISNRFGLQIPALTGEFGYFGRQYSPELMQFIAERPAVQAYFFGETTRRSKANVYALLNDEKGRKLRDFDFYEAENVVRKAMTEQGYPKDLPIWSRDAFGDLAAKTRKAQAKAEARTLVNNFVDAVGNPDAARVEEAATALRAQIQQNRVDNAARILKAEEAVQAAKQMQAGFREARPEIRAAGKAQAREAEKIPESAQQVADVVQGQREVRASLKVEKDLRKMFPGAEGAADDAEAAMRGMVDATSGKLADNPRAKAVVEKFYDNYQKAADTEGYRAAVRQFGDDLRQVVSPEVAKEYTRLADDALKQLERLEKAQGAVAKPVAQAVNQRVRDAEKALADAVEAAQKGDFDNWTLEQKVKWVESRTTKLRDPNNITGLEVLRRAKVALPDDLDELVRLGVTEFSEGQAKQFRKLADGVLWAQVDDTTKIGKVFDAIKRVFQQDQLGRPGSTAKDLRGTAINGAMSGNTPYLNEARQAFGGFDNWRKGGRMPDAINRLVGEGPLQTTTSEAIDARRAAQGRASGTFEQLGREAESKLGKAAARVGQHFEERGFMGGVVPKALGGEKITAARDYMNDMRVYWEQVNRYATYLKARKEGLSHGEAVEEIHKWWGKFDELSRLERKVFNRIMFFWAWQARSIPISVRHIFTHPVRSKLVLMMTAGDASDNKTMPEWLRRMGGWILGRDENGRATVMNTGGTYFDPMLSMLQSNFVNEALSGRVMNPLDMGLGAVQEIARSGQPLIGAAVEGLTKRDLFSGHDWWRERNAEAESNIKAPTAFWWLQGDNAISRVLGLKKRGIKHSADKEDQYLVMDPRWAWVFGALPGVETTLNDVSAFFSAPDISGGAEPAPKVTAIRGVARQLGFPVYEVPLDDGKQQIFQLKQALARDGDSVPGLKVHNMRLIPSDTFEGESLRGDMKRWRGAARIQGMTESQRDEYVVQKTLQYYPEAGRLLSLQRRVEAWERHLINLERGVMIEPGMAGDVQMAARRAETSRVSEFNERKRREAIRAMIR